MYVLQAEDASGQTPEYSQTFATRLQAKIEAMRQWQIYGRQYAVALQGNHYLYKVMAESTIERAEYIACASSEIEAREMVMQEISSEDMADHIRHWLDISPNLDWNDCVFKIVSCDQDKRMPSADYAGRYCTLMKMERS